MRRTVIARKFMPAHLPMNTTAIGWLLMDRLNSPGWVHGAFWTVMGLFWVSAIVLMATEDSRDPFTGKGA